MLSFAVGNNVVSESTATNGYLGVYGMYVLPSITAETLGDLKGSWYYENYGYYIMIRGTTYTDFLDDGDDREDYLNIVGDIVECTDATQESGILYIKVIGIQGLFSAGKYVAVAWQNKDDGSIEFATGTVEKDTLAGIKTAYSDIAAFPGNSFDIFAKEAVA